jgi:formylglycine-generating enzyme required for sulfatase activity
MARAGRITRYPWGDEIGKKNANCKGCGSQWYEKQTVPVGSFKPNAFGLYDMLGNVSTWVEDCYHHGYEGAPTDGSPWVNGKCVDRVIRGGSWYTEERDLRSASRARAITDYRDDNLGFRLSRTLHP